jgi:hypothetical protein
MGWRSHCATTVIVQYRPARDMPIKASDSGASLTSLLTRRPYVEARNKCLEAQVSSIFTSLSRALPDIVTLQIFGRSVILRGDGRYQNAARGSLSISFRHCGGS